MALNNDELGNVRIRGMSEDLKIRLGYFWPGTLETASDIHDIYQLPVLTLIGKTVPLSTLANHSMDNVPQAFIHKDGERAVIVSAEAGGNRSASDIMLSFKSVLDQVKKEWKEGYDYELGGEWIKIKNSNSEMGKAFLIALFLIFIMLVLLFNSMGQAIVIILIIPLAITGTLFGFFLIGIPLSYNAMVGIIALVGIAVNDAIVLVHTANHNRHKGQGLSLAVADAAASRLRPILSTTLTTVLGMLPLAFSDPRWYPLCMAIALGLLSSTAVALVIIPALYTLSSEG